MQKDEYNSTMVTLYPEDEHDMFLLTIWEKKFPDHMTYIYHSRDHDIFGHIEKTHIHCIINNIAALSKEAWEIELSIPVHRIEFIKSEKASYRYLIHFDNPEKAQYDLSEVLGNSFPVAHYCRDFESEKLRKLMNAFRLGDITTIGQYNRYCLDNRLNPSRYLAIYKQYHIECNFNEMRDAELAKLKYDYSRLINQENLIIDKKVKEIIKNGK